MDSNDWLYPTSTGYILKVQVVPGAAENKIIGPHGDRLKIRIAAIPEKGGANKALLAFLAHRLGLTKNQIRLEKRWPGQVQSSLKL